MPSRDPSSSSKHKSEMFQPLEWCGGDGHRRNSGGTGYHGLPQPSHRSTHGNGRHSLQTLTEQDWEYLIGPSLSGLKFGQPLSLNGPVFLKLSLDASLLLDLLKLQIQMNRVSGVNTNFER